MASIISHRRRTKGRLIAFEGVDGAGKSTVIALVAERLRARGESVFLPRSGKDHASRPVRGIRELTRDRRNLELSARAELLLYCAREAQLMAELIEPALQRGETVLIDRCVMTAVVLARTRGIARADCEGAATAACPTRAPDLTVVFDVHPQTARIRKRLERIRKRGHEEEGGRKGLAGSAFKERLRRFYAELAAEAGHQVLHAERATPDELAKRAFTLIDRAASADALESVLDRTPLWIAPEGLALPYALEHLPQPMALLLGNGLACTRGLRARALEVEPALCAYTLDLEDPLRERLAKVVPEYALRNYGRRPLGGTGDLRLALLDRAPAACVAALRHLRDGRSDALRQQLAHAFPDAVVSSLAGREDAFAQELRARCWPNAADPARAASLLRCDGDAAWRYREQLFDRDPAHGLHSLRGLCGTRTDALLERFAEHAPKTVLEALSGRADPPLTRFASACSRPAAR